MTAEDSTEPFYDPVLGLNIAGFTDETYERNIHLIWNCNESQRIAYLRQYCEKAPVLDDDWDGRMTECYLGDGKGCVTIIAMRKWNKNNPAAISALAHECYHAVERTMIATGTIYEYGKTSEPWAYLLGSYLRRSMVLMNKKIDKTK